MLLSCLASLELCGTLLQKRLRAFLFVFRSGAESEERSFQRKTFVLARLQSFVDRFERVLHCERRISENLFQNGFSARNQLRGRDDFVNESDAIRFLRADHFSGENGCSARPFPTSRGNRCVPPPPGITPSFTSG